MKTHLVGQLNFHVVKTKFEKELIDPSVSEGGLYTAETGVKQKGTIILAVGKSQALRFLGRSIRYVSSSHLHQTCFIYSDRFCDEMRIMVMLLPMITLGIHKKTTSL
jgi:hypothetical protein